MIDFAVFRTFQEENDAKYIIELLNSHDIPTEIEKNKPLLDKIIIGNEYFDSYFVKIPANQFLLAQKILMDAVNINYETVDRNYMLFRLTNEELIDVISKPDEWGAYNYKLALCIIEERGLHLKETEIKILQQESITALEKPRILTVKLLASGYLFSIIAIITRIVYGSRLNSLYSFYFLPGIFGFILGFVILFTKKTLPNGRMVYSYSTRSRWHGVLMIILCIVSFILNWVI